MRSPSGSSARCPAWPVSVTSPRRSPMPSRSPPWSSSSVSTPTGPPTTSATPSGKFARTCRRLSKSRWSRALMSRAERSSTTPSNPAPAMPWTCPGLSMMYSAGNCLACPGCKKCSAWAASSVRSRSNSSPIALRRWASRPTRSTPSCCTATATCLAGGRFSPTASNPYAHWAAP
ncbi:hypothetical protein D3C79_586190 [compost metagenome]